MWVIGKQSAVTELVPNKNEGEPSLLDRAHHYQNGKKKSRSCITQKSRNETVQLSSSKLIPFKLQSWRDPRERLYCEIYYNILTTSAGHICTSFLVYLPTGALRMDFGFGIIGLIPICCMKLYSTCFSMYEGA